MSTSPISIFLYMLHSPLIKARLGNVQKLSDLCNARGDIRFNLVTSQEPLEITPDLIKSIVNITPTPDMPPQFSSILRSIHVNQLSNSLKHFTALRMVVENAKEHPNARHVIVEDDVLFNENDVFRLLDSTILSSPKDADVVFLGLPSTKSGTPQDVSFENMTSVFKMLPCCDSYIVTAAAASKMINAFLPIRFPTQIQLSYIVEKLELKSFVCSPNVFIDGSKLGVYMSSIDANNMLIWNPQFHQIRMILGKPTLSIEDMKTVDELLKTAHFKDHADFLYLSAQNHTLNKRYVEAEKDFARAFDIYVAENSVFGPDCIFMKDFTRIYRHLQPAF